MKNLPTLCIGLVVFVFLITSGLAQPSSDISQANNQFAFDLYPRLASNPGNIFFSPYSLTSALAMTYEGAKGQTADEIRTVLHLPSDETDWRSDVLISMGIKTAFDSSKADLTGMAHKVFDENLYISEVFHKAWIETNEEGTEAAAATAVTIDKSLAMRVPMELKIFRADHPFIFMIQDNKSGHILFMGRVSDPREK